MYTRKSLLMVLIPLTLGACGGAAPEPPAPVTPEPPAEPLPSNEPVAEGAERPVLAPAECEARGGTVVGDIGDGAVHRPDYTCPSGAKPIGTVPSGIEGAVCCPG